jgi:hypothetical protein
VILEDDDDYYYNHPDKGWVDTDTEEEPMELPKDHPRVSSGSNEVHPMVVMMTQMMIQSQLSLQAHRHLSPMMRSRYITWTLLKVHSPRFSGGPCRELASR